jgi:hypothetical protein
MDGVRIGNSQVDGATRRGWFVGRFIHDDAYRQTHDLEVKWGVHPAGDSNGTFAADVVARTLSVLIRGRFRLTFRSGERQEDVLLQREGDYALWLPGVEHTWQAEAEDTDTIVLTVRWPSFPVAQREAD